MRRKFTCAGEILVRTTVLIALVAGVARGATADSPVKPLKAVELLALIAGNALPENIVHEISTQGLAFRPNDSYRALLKTAGADATIVA
ncbi:MAG TPA: hypothetical protein VMJ13_10890, partial [Candidatus Acidoferrum sp.]|nr:hypothetical protein [Candidatus Acidoferrum sp.]